MDTGKNGELEIHEGMLKCSVDAGYGTAKGQARIYRLNAFLGNCENEIRERGNIE